MCFIEMAGGCGGGYHATEFKWTLEISYLKDSQQGHRSYQTGQRQGKKDEGGNAAGLLPFSSWETGNVTTTLVSG